MRIALLTLACLATFFAPRCAMADDPALARAMAARGLVLNGKYWICGEEARLRRRLDALDRQEAAFHPAWKKFRDVSGEYFRLKTLLTRLRDALEQIQTQLGENSLSAGRRQQLQGERKKLSDRILELERKTNKQLGALDAYSPLNQAVVDFVNARNAVSISLLQVQSALDAVDASYARLAQNEQVANLLATTGDRQSLGPMENYRRKNRPALDRLGKLVFADGIPFYRRSGQYRLSLIVNEQTPITFSFVGGDGPTLVPASLLAASGVEMPADAPVSEVEIGQRTVRARRAVLPTLRVGKQVVKSVPVYVLPPEAEDLGARISMTAFGEYETDLDADRLWFRLR